ncbi:16S rRNA (uracil(1498)-N(3))-methyltransferase [Hoeflea sp. TYP-13]|uniref:16S rRNA (uracil(1498)-N(3))-methyltransferase n=1 Tax=Hoeflea sp. TYP-13 TaxID=3230023 RepID=UPI0034C5C178
MRANYKMQRLYVEADLESSGTVPTDKEQFNYLAHVLRMSQDSEVLLFNGRDGEWSAKLHFESKKRLILQINELVRPQPEPSDLHYLFAPLKQARLDYTVQKAVEMGAGVIQPVLTHHTQASRFPAHRLQRNAVEAAEQCGILSIPDCREPVKLAKLLEGWDPARRIIYCDESARTHNPLAILQSVSERELAVFIGPEGGFSDEERELLQSCAFVTAIPLGPRILRADTAAVAAMAVIQSTIGDW